MMNTRTTLFLRDQLWAALGLAILPSGCASEDYGECDRREVAELDLLTEDAGAVSGNLYCVEEIADAATCMACDEECQADLESTFGSEHSNSESGYFISMQCGPMWLDEGCCFDVGLGEWMAGRPYRVEGAARLASPHIGEGWAATPTPDALPAEHRSALSEHWTRMALAEHASIASFARFSLQLLHLGAPSSLVLAACRAQLDEVHHATACFSIASQALGCPVGPGTLDVRDPSGPTLDRREVAIATFVEGCVNETIAAAEASLAASRATWGPARETLTRIAIDEAQHAALAWQTVQWLLKDSPELLAELQEALAQERHRLGSHADRPGLPAFGVLSGAERAALAHDVLARVIGPTLEAMGRAMEIRHKTEVFHASMFSATDIADSRSVSRG